MRGRTGNLLLAAAAVAAACAVFALLRAPSDRIVERTPDDDAAPGAGPSLAARPARTAVVPAPPDASIVAGGSPAGGRRLHVEGLVRAPRDVRLPGTRVHLVPAESRALSARREAAGMPDPVDADRPATSTRLKEDDSYAAGVEAFPEWADTIRAVVEVPGFVIGLGEADVPAGVDRVRVDVSFEQVAQDTLGRRVTRGRVVDESGRALVGLPVIVQSFPGAPAMVPVEWTQGQVGPALGLRGLAVTDEEGRFQIRGLRCGGCARAISGDPAWFVVDDAGNREVVRGDAVLTAWPSTRLTLEVEDAAGRPAGEFVVHVDVEGDEPLRWTSRNGRLDASWPMSPAARARPTAVAVEMRSHRSATFSLEPTPGARRHAAKTRLVALPARETGRLEVTVGGPGARHAGSRPTVVLRVAGTTLPLHVLHLVAEGEGFAATVPVGVWDCELRPFWEEDVLVRGTARAEVRPGETARISWEVPELGALRVVLGEEGEQIVGTVVLTRPGTVPLRFPMLGSARVPTGEWTVQVLDAGNTEVARGLVQVSEKRTVVRLDRR